MHVSLNLRSSPADILTDNHILEQFTTEKGVKFLFCAVVEYKTPCSGSGHLIFGIIHTEVVCMTEVIRVWQSLCANGCAISCIFEQLWCESAYDTIIYKPIHDNSVSPERR